jgi:aryl-alcohol dehydrogenase-like predicted oxidoreductase
MKTRALGRQGLQVSELGLGCMGMSFAYGPSDEAECIRVLHRSLELGINFWDTAEMYGPFKNEELLGRALKGKDRDRVVIATKFAYEFTADNKPLRLNSSPAHVRTTVEGSLQRLNTDRIDLYYQHRLDPNTPIEETVGAMADLVKAGKVRALGLSEVGPGTIARAHAVHPISAVQTEYSLWERGAEEKIIPTLRRLGIGFVAYSPIGRGFLSGNIKSASDLDTTDWRRNNPRFQDENFQHNLQLVENVKKLAVAVNATPAQVALAWLLRKGDDIVPIPGTRHLAFLEENARATQLKLTPKDWAELDEWLAHFKVSGQRYPDAAMATIDTN